MLQAYFDGKDLYCEIGTGVFNNNYEDNLEFYPPSTELEIDGKKIIAGDGATPYELEFSDDDFIDLKPFNIIHIESKGDTQAAYLEVGDKIADGPVIKNIINVDGIIRLSF